MSCFAFSTVKKGQIQTNWQYYMLLLSDVQNLPYITRLGFVLRRLLNQITKQ
jgi:hypothetical protein